MAFDGEGSGSQREGHRLSQPACARRRRETKLANRSRQLKLQQRRGEKQMQTGADFCRRENHGFSQSHQ